jgi:hypothetical protein
MAFVEAEDKRFAPWALRGRTHEHLSEKKLAQRELLGRDLGAKIAASGERDFR